MSGNGIRCLAWVAARAGLGPTTASSSSTPRRAGGECSSTAPAVRSWPPSVDMGPVTFEPARIPVAVDDPFELEADGRRRAYRGDAAGMGNPHLVLFVDDPAAAPVTTHGPASSTTTASRAAPTSSSSRVTPTPTGSPCAVWERGVGETLSCGTGACAVAAVAHRRELVGDARHGRRARRRR